MILIIGSQEEFHSKHMFEYIQSRGEEVKYLDTRTIPENFISSWYTDLHDLTGYIIIDGEKIEFSRIKSVYWRWHYGINIQNHILEREFTSYVESIFDALKCKWVNSQNAIKMHRNKPYQLNLMGKNGIRIPKTLITTDKDELLKFIESFDGELIFKPVRGGAHTQVLSKDDLTLEKLDLLKYSPVTFQEKLQGVDLRIYVIGKDVFAAEIRAGSVDFREDPAAEIVPVKIPEVVKNDCYRIMDLLDLKFSGIDVKYNPETREYIFIEANPSPMFHHFENKSGFPITESLFQLLAS